MSTNFKLILFFISIARFNFECLSYECNISPAADRFLPANCAIIKNV